MITEFISGALILIESSFIAGASFYLRSDLDRRAMIPESALIHYLCQIATLMASIGGIVGYSVASGALEETGLIVTYVRDEQLCAVDAVYLFSGAIMLILSALLHGMSHLMRRVVIHVPEIIQSRWRVYTNAYLNLVVATGTWMAGLVYTSL